MALRLRAWLIRKLGVSQCGAFGGYTGKVVHSRFGAGAEIRWCTKPFGHSDSCAYDPLLIQPGAALRARCRGWS